MRILIIESCTGRKSVYSKVKLECKDILNKNDRKKLFENPEIAKQTIPARDLYAGSAHIWTMKAVDVLRTIPELEVDLFIISAGFGLVNENDLLSPYECTFKNMSKEQIKTRAKFLEIPDDLKKLFTRRYDVIFILLGEDYLYAAGNALFQIPTSTTGICFASEKNIPKLTNIVSITINNQIVKEFTTLGLSSYGVVGIRGTYLFYFALIVKKHDTPTKLLRKIKEPQFARNFFRPKNFEKYLSPSEKELRIENEMALFKNHQKSLPDFFEN